MRIADSNHERKREKRARHDSDVEAKQIKLRKKKSNAGIQRAKQK